MVQNTMAKRKNEKIWGVLVYLFSIPAIIYVYLSDKKKNPFILYHTKQSLALLIMGLVITTPGLVLPLVGWFVILPLGYLVLLILYIIGMLNAWNGKKKAVPVIGKYAENIDFLG